MPGSASPMQHSTAIIEIRPYRGGLPLDSRFTGRVLVIVGTHVVRA